MTCNKRTKRKEAIPLYNTMKCKRKKYAIYLNPVLSVKIHGLKIEMTVNANYKIPTTTVP